MRTISLQSVWQEILSSMAAQNTLALSIIISKNKSSTTGKLIADVLTKGLSQEKFEKLRLMCGMSDFNLTAS